MSVHRKFLLLALCVVLALACSRADDSEDAGKAVTAHGVFKANVSGLTYVSGKQRGVTGPDGGFTYEEGQSVTFSVGGVTIGAAPGKPVITSVDLVATASLDSTEVLNLVRFLMMLDEDGNPDNGVHISAAVQAGAATWPQVDFASADLSVHLAPIVAGANAADGVPHSLPDADVARASLEATLRCVYAGAFLGTFSGDRRGAFGFLADATNGAVTGLAYVDDDDEPILLAGVPPIDHTRQAAFVSGTSEDGVRFSGRFTSADQVSGTWTDPEESLSGTFEGRRIGRALDAAYRFTGAFFGDDSGLFAFDLDRTDGVTGVAYAFDEEEEYPVTGRLQGTQLDGSAGDSRFTGTLDKSSGTLSGTWSGELSGSFSGDGCKLNPAP